MSEEFGRMYEGENRMSGLFKAFSILPILIACLGLFGLSSYLAEQRTKEIGIRKVMGASLPEILRLLFTPFLTLLIFACLVAIPLGWFMMNRWLEDLCPPRRFGCIHLPVKRVIGRFAYRRCS